MAIKIKYYEKDKFVIRYAIINNDIWYLNTCIGFVLQYAYFPNIISKYVEKNNKIKIPYEGRQRVFINRKGIENIRYPSHFSPRFTYLKNLLREIEEIEKENLLPQVVENVETPTFEALWDSASEDVKNAVCQLLLALANQPKIEKKIIKFV